MKFQRVKDIALGAIVATLVMGTAPAAFAKVANINIPVQYNNIKVVVDGKELSTSKEPFIYDGTTYLPLRAVAEAVGMNVTWDAATKTANLTSGSKVEVPRPVEPPVETKQEEQPVKKEEGLVGTVDKKTNIDEQGVKIKCTSVKENYGSFGGIELDFSITNSTSSEYIIYVNEMTINGKKMNGSIYSNVLDDRTAKETMHIWGKDLKEAGIEKLNEIRISFHASNADDYWGSFDTNELVVKFK